MVKFGERDLSESLTQEEQHPPKRARVIVGGEVEADAGIGAQPLWMVSGFEAEDFGKALIRRALERLEGWVLIDVHGHGVDVEVVAGGFDGGGDVGVGNVDGVDEMEMKGWVIIESDD